MDVEGDGQGNQNVMMIVLYRIRLYIYLTPHTCLMKLFHRAPDYKLQPDSREWPLALSTHIWRGWLQSLPEPVLSSTSVLHEWLPMADVPVCRVTPSESSPGLFWLLVIGVKHGECLGLALVKQLSSFHLFNFLPPSLLFIYLVGTASSCSGQNVWLCWTFLCTFQGWIPPDSHSTVAWGEAGTQFHNVLQRRDGGNLQKCIFTGWKPLCSPWSWPSLENSLLFIPPCACAKSFSNSIGSVPQQQAQKIWLAG